jgi:uncharacterized phage infection (PIP) family protein YhgE
MQQTLSFLTNLDQTIGNTEKMKELDQFYKAINVSTKDLFHLLRDVCIFFFIIFTLFLYILQVGRKSKQLLHCLSIIAHLDRSCLP